MENKHDLTTGSIRQNLLKAAVPLIIAMLVETGYNLVDTIFVGRLGPNAIAAVTLVFPVVFFMFAMGGGIATGASALIAQSVGAKKYKDADNISEHTIFLSLILAIFFTVLGLSTIKPLFTLLGAGPEILGLVHSYISIIYIGSTFMFLGMMGSALLRGVGDMKTQMKAMILSAVLNIILDPIFIFVLDLGVKGAAIATILSRLVGCIFIYQYILRKKTVLTLQPKLFRYDAEYIKHILKVGLPASAGQVSMSIGWAALAKIASYFGPVAIAALGIGFRIDTLAILPTLGLGIAVITLVGQNIGAGKPKRAKETTIQAIGMGTSFLLVLSSIFMIFPEQIIRVFSDNSLLIHYTTLYIHSISPTYFFICLGIIIGSAILGTGRPMAQLIITLIRVLILSVPVAYILSIKLSYGVVGIWWGIAIATVISGFISLIYYYRINWTSSVSKV